MKIQNKILVLSFLLIGLIFFFVQFFDFTLTGKVTTETADTGGLGDVGKFSSIALDSNNKVHVSYLDDEGPNGLRYCNNTAGSWPPICQGVDTGVGGGGLYSSIAIDSNDKIHFSHYDSTNNDLRYCNNTEGSFESCARVDNNSVDDLGKYSSIAIDSNDKIHISHYNATGGDLRYCNNTASDSSWSCGIVAKSCSFNAECLSGSCDPTLLICTGDDRGLYSSIAIDSNNKIHTSEYVDVEGSLRYCNNTASDSSWTCTNVETTNDVGNYSSIAIDSNDKIHISHYDATNNDLRYCNNTVGTWSCAEIDADSEILCGSDGDCPANSGEICSAGFCVSDNGISSSITIDSSNKIHMSHYSASGDDLRYCNNINGSWVCSKLADADSNSLGTPNGRALAIKKGRIVDSTSFSTKVHISWYNNTDLMYTSYDSFDPTATASCSPSTISNGGTFPCTCSGTDAAGSVTTAGTSTGSLTDMTVAGSFTYTCTVTDGEGNSASATASYTVTEVVVTGSLSATTPIAGEPTLAKSHLLAEVNPGDETTISTFEDTGIKEVIIVVNQEAKNVRIKVSKYDEKPTEVSVENTGKTYRYLQISTENLNENLEKATVKFEVEKIWVSDNNLGKEEITILKFDESAEKWNELETNFDNEDDNFYYYTIELDSFSFFAIGEKVKEEFGGISEIVDGEIRGKNFKGFWWVFSFILVMGIVVIIIYVIKKKKEEGIFENKFS